MVRLFTYGPTFQFQKVHFYFTHNKGQELTEADLTKFLLRYSQIFRPAMSEFHQVCCFTNETLPYFLFFYFGLEPSAGMIKFLKAERGNQGQKGLRRRRGFDTRRDGFPAVGLNSVIDFLLVY